MVFNVNGKQLTVEPEPGVSLLSVLREDLDLTGSKYGCGEGACGSCTVLIDGKPTRACNTPASEVAGKQVITIEALEKNGRLHPVQEAFLQADPFQCGYCAPGMIMSAVALLEKNPTPTEDEIIGSMNGNICRCGTYPRIVKAIQLASNQTGRR
jgi:aerobic-type carbon monoxide dehydrogenase small subunit (CoxS/CutS family)